MALVLLFAGALMARSHEDGTKTPVPSTNPSTPGPGPTGKVVIAAAGEIACAQPPHVAAFDNCRYDSTAQLLDPGKLTAVLALGDNQYESGTFNEYRAYYDPWWGKVKSITEPVPGDHDYNLNPSSNAHGYYAYWGSNAEGRTGFGYRSFNLPFGCAPGHGICWHVVALNSELCLLPGGCGPATPGVTPGPGNDMYRWLERDLSSHANDRFSCTLAFWHHPLFLYSTGSGSTTEVQPLWDQLYRAGADVVLNSNSHNYQRWEPLDPTGAVDPERGIREFVIGLGGVKKESLTSDLLPAGLAAAQDTSFGVLQMGLTRTGYTWEWVSAAGQPAFSDSQATAVDCH